MLYSVIYDKKRHNTTKFMKTVDYITWNGLKKSLYVNCILITEDRLLITNNWPLTKINKIFVDNHTKQSYNDKAVVVAQLCMGS